MESLVEMNRNMETQDTINYWVEIDGGFRGSLLLRLGAIALAIGVLSNLGTQLLAGPYGPSLNLTTLSWLLFILGLWLAAGGFTWVGADPFFTRFGFVVGIFHAAQGIQLLVVLFTFTPTTVPPISLTVGRLVSLLLFVWLEKEWLNTRTRSLLAGAVSLQLLKVSLRGLEYLPALGTPLDPLLDTVLLLAIAAALLQVSSVVRHEENDWAKSVYETGHSDFDDFNNPEHDWNKTPLSGGK